MLNLIFMSFGMISLEFGLFYAASIEYFEQIYKLKQSRVHESRADEWGLMLI